MRPGSDTNGGNEHAQGMFLPGDAPDSPACIAVQIAACDGRAARMEG
jgi:hypothetical protein